MSVYGSGFEGALGLRCRFGLTVSPSAVQYVSSSSVRCVAPTVAEGVVQVDVSNDGVEYSDSGVLYGFEVMPALVDVVPSVCTSVGGSTLTVIGASFRAGAGLRCRVGGGDDVEGRLITPSTVECMTPRMSTGEATVEVSNNARDYELWSGVVVVRGDDEEGRLDVESGGGQGGAVPTVERGFRDVVFCSMEIAGDRPSIRSTSGFCIISRN